MSPWVLAACTVPPAPLLSWALSPLEPLLALLPLEGRREAPSQRA